MLPLSTVEGEDTEEVKTKPPEKGALLSENTDDPPKKPSRMKGRMSLKILPFCPLPSFCFTYYLEPDDSDSDSETAPEPLKPDSNCTVIPIVGLDFKEIKVCECPLCCLTFFSASYCISAVTRAGGGTGRLRHLTRVRRRGRGRGRAARSGPAASGPASVCTASPGVSGAGPARRRGRAPRRTSGVTMLPLSAVEGKDTEEVKTTPPEKGALLSENTDDPPSKPSRMKGRMSFKIMPICPLPSFCFTYYLEPDDSDSDSETAPEPLKPDSNCTVIPIVGLDFKEIKVCECPLCCLTFFSAS
ncbi:uncharacterized protein LOC135322197 [Camelus dromedarius]|uniref:uncharacterized protein LOC135322197 n=1 Tax=Camelus dromedarius TaxID=9838 RepID=UPI00311A3C6B